MMTEMSFFLSRLARRCITRLKFRAIIRQAFSGTTLILEKGVHRFRELRKRAQS